MPKPRSTLISLETTPYYHCVSRCVRRAFLCGTDTITGNTYEHRRQLIEDKMLELGSIFALNICAYAVMSNHYHIILHIDKDQAESWSFDEVINQWHKLFSGNLLSKRYIKGEKQEKAELRVLQKTVKLWRERLMNISWFMRVLNETIARQANAEDNCTGRFWEGRFKTQALLDDSALLSCMAYVDLNPIRAGMVSTPEASGHTSIRQRLLSMSNQSTNPIKQQPPSLFPFVDYPRKNLPCGLAFRLTDYIELVDWTGRILRDDKRCYIDNNIPPILQRLNIQQDNWLYLCQHFESPFKGLVGSVFRLKQACEQMGYKRTPGALNCAIYFP